MKKLLSLFAILVLCSTSMATTIDEFENTSIMTNVYGTVYNAIYLQSDATLRDTTIGVLGGVRDVAVDFSVDGYPANAFVISDISEGWGDAGSLSLGGSSTAQFTLTYSAGDAGLNTDLSSGTKITLDFDPDHVGYLRTSIVSVILNDGVNSAEVSYSWSSYLMLPRTQLDFTFAAFLADNASLDLTSIDSIALHYVSDHDNDVSFYSLTTDAVPEPATIALLGLGGLLFARKRKA